jgi:hypothetical protein
VGPWCTAYPGNKAVQLQLVLGKALIEGTKLGQGVSQGNLLCPQLGHGELELHATGLSLQGGDRAVKISQAERHRVSGKRQDLTWRERPSKMGQGD